MVTNSPTGQKEVNMASTKDKAVLEILYVNKEIFVLKAEIAEIQAFIDFHNQVSAGQRKPSWYMAVSKAEEQLQSLKWDLHDLYEERKQEFIANGFTQADFGHENETDEHGNQADAKWYSDLKSCPDCRPEYISEDGKTCQKYRALDNEDLRHATPEQCKKYALQFFKLVENDKHDDWSNEEKENFKQVMGLTVEEWRATQKPMFSKRVA